MEPTAPETPAKTTALNPPPLSTQPSTRGSRQDRAAFRLPSKHRVAVVLTLILVPTMLAIGTWCSYWASHRQDQYQLITLGQAVYDGGQLYIDAWENKPPGVAWMNALGIALSGGGRLGVWLLPGFAALGALGFFWWTSSYLLSPLAARRMTLLSSVVLSLRLYDAPSIHPDFYSAVAELVACCGWLLSLYALRTRVRVGAALLAGLGWAVAVTFKQTGAVGLVALTIGTCLVIVVRAEPWRRWLTTTLVTWIGFAAGVGVVVGVLAADDSLTPAWHAVVTFNHAYWSADHLSSALDSWRRAVEGLSPVRLLVWLGFLGASATLMSRCAHRVRMGAIWVLLFWWLGQVALALLGPSQSMRYWQATWPPMLWLAGIGLFQLEDTFLRLPRGFRAAFVLTGAMLLLILARPMAWHHKHGLAETYVAYSADPNERTRLRQLGGQVRDRVPPGKRFYVLAYDAGIYVHADRRPASRFTYPRSQEQMEEILSDLESDQAYAILVPDRPAPGFEQWCDEVCHSRLRSILNQYEQTPTLGGYEMWVVRSNRRKEPL